jgi:hypothetical protein
MQPPGGSAELYGIKQIKKDEKPNKYVFKDAKRIIPVHVAKIREKRFIS